MTYFTNPLNYLFIVIMGNLLPLQMVAQTPADLQQVLTDYNNSILLYNSNPTQGTALNHTGILTTSTINDPIKMLTCINEDGEEVPPKIQSCPKLLVDVTIPFLQSCMPSTAIVTYCNHGSDTAYNAYIEITLDSNLVLDSASIAYTALGSHQYRLDIGTVPTGLCKNIDLHLTTVCDIDLMGKAHCIAAHIYPDTLCAAIQPSALLEVEGNCVGDAIQFRITNHGTPLRTAKQVRYIIIDDHLIIDGEVSVLEQGTLEVDNQSSFNTSIPINSNTQKNYKMEIRDAQQNIIAVCFVELCTGNNANVAISSDFYASNFWNGSPLPFTDQECAINGELAVNDFSGDNTNNTSSIAQRENPNQTIITAPIEQTSPSTAVHLQVTPNPMQHYATLALKGEQQARYQFELYNATGQRMKSLTLKGNTTTTIEKGNLPAGLYVYRVSSQGMALQQGKLLVH